MYRKSGGDRLNSSRRSHGSEDSYYDDDDDYAGQRRTRDQSRSLMLVPRGYDRQVPDDSDSDDSSDDSPPDSPQVAMAPSSSYYSIPTLMSLSLFRDLLPRRIVRTVTNEETVFFDKRCPANRNAPRKVSRKTQIMAEYEFPTGGGFHFPSFSNFPSFPSIPSFSRNSTDVRPYYN